MELSVRSGGHSFLCNNLKNGGIHLDMRGMNKVHQLNDHEAILGPGSDWGRVLSIIPRDKYSMVHGQCLTVGVGGYLLGGGINTVGLSEAYGSGASNVIEFTLVTAEGDVARVSRTNATVWRYSTGEEEFIPDTWYLHLALGGAGGSYGIVTEFLYKIYPHPEPKPIVSYVFFESPSDLRNYERAAKQGTYHISFFYPYMFHQTWAENTWENLLGSVVFPPMLKFLNARKTQPIFISMVENDNPFRPPDNEKGRAFLRSFGIKLDKTPVTSIIPNKFELGDYEHVYLSEKEFKKQGYQATASANFMGIKSLRIMEKFLFHHPVFGKPRVFFENNIKNK